MNLVELRKKAELAIKEKQEMLPVTDINDPTEKNETHPIELGTPTDSEGQRYYDHYMFAPLGYVVMDRNGHIEDANLSACRLLGRNRQQVIGSPLTAYFDDASRRHFLHLLDTVFEQNVTQTAELRLTPNGQAPVHVTAVLQTFADACRHLVRLTLMNITERVDEEQRLRESERFASSIVNALDAHIAILNEAGTIITVNNAWLKFAGENNAALNTVGTGMNYLDVLREVDATSADSILAHQALHGIEQVMRGELSAFALEYPCHSPHERRWFNMRVTRFDHDGQMRVAVAHENVTQRVTAEEKVMAYNAHLEDLIAGRTAQLQRLNKRMDAVLSNVSNPIILIDGDGCVDVTNPAFDRKLGYEADELYGQSMLQIFDPICHPTLITALNLARTEGSVTPIQTRLIARDGTGFDAEVSLNAVPGNEGHMVCTLYDISHLKEMERMKDDFISLVSHELRTPVTSMMLGASAIERYFDRLTEEQKLEKLKQISQQAQTLAEMVTSILDISHLSAYRDRHSESCLNVVHALRDVVEELTSQAEARQQQIHVEIVSNQAWIRGEHFDLVRVWRNLIGNAIKYTAEGGEIIARLYGANPSADYAIADAVLPFLDSAPADLASGRYIIGLVEDNGHGMRPQDVSRLFTRFYRGWAAGTNITGTGLGLALVRDLLRLYGGDIAVMSELGVGTTFCFWIPVDEMGA